MSLPIASNLLRSRQLLRQRPDGKLLEQPQTRPDPSAGLRHARLGAPGFKSPVDFETQLN
jgi:hypothetical protein